MKPFADWVGSQAESIIDASHIGPHTHELPVVVTPLVTEDPMGQEGWTEARQNAYEHWMRRMEQDFEY